MTAKWCDLVSEVLAEFSTDRNEQARLRAKLKESSETYQLAFGGLMTGFSAVKVKVLLRRALSDMTEEL